MIDTDVHTLTLDDPAELVAYVPYRLGFHPAESLVVLSVREHAPREVSLGLLARFDLADVREPDIARLLRSQIDAHLEREDCVAAWLLVYRDADPGDPADATELSDLLDEARALLRPWRENPLTSAGRCYLVDGSRWHCLECTHEPACPAEGRSRAELDATAIAAAMVLRGRPVAASREELVRVRAGTASGAETAQRVCRARLAEFVRLHGAGRRAAWRRSMARAWDATLAPDAPAPTPTRFGVLLAGLSEKFVRDAVLTVAMAGGSVAQALARPASTHAAMDTSSPPDVERVERVSALIEQAIRHSGPDDATPAWTSAAWLAWWLGDGARCDLLLAQAERLGEPYRLAILLRRLLDAQIPPGWVDRSERREGRSNESAER